ncbi:GbsR/MarR family transcriptional regulator [Patulibacter defluvii]|uniref:GbsR/MarR family transcriptional regulator n=1 Tax=Patulibacter defluvii TaxID=3095358 RepID=UPI002A7513E7|nr:MarR family transcriptional regulator [Patulibacter sp. DM4]
MPRSTPRRDDDPPRDEEAVARFVERFAAALVESGMQRMPARVFGAILSSPDGRLTAAELAERLRTSAASISGAVRYLEQVRLVVREREPGSRRDVFVVHDDAWYEASVRRDEQLRRWVEVLADGVGAVGPDSAAGARLRETQEFFAFAVAELPRMLERWRATRDG